MPGATNHHFVSQVYLRGFAEGEGPQAQIFVVDRVEQRTFTTGVRNVGARRHFNRIETDELDPNALEEAYGEFEGQVNTSLRRIKENQSFDCEEDRLVVLNLMALFAVRNPRLRGRVSRFIGDTYQIMAEMMTSTPERWEAIQRQMREQGLEVPSGENVTYEEMRDSVRSDQLEFSPHQNHLIALELNNHDAVLNTLVERNWMVLIAGDDAGDFVTSDHPVVLMGAPSIFSSRQPVGYGMTQTTVLFPVTRKLFLNGTFEGQDGIHRLGRADVALLNASMIFGAERQVYAHDDRFTYSRSDRLASGDELVADPLFIRSESERS
jgi:hypothetical protein